MNKRIASLSLTILLLGVTRVASADDAPATSQSLAEVPPGVTSHREWYGYQTLIADGAAGTGLVVAFAVESASRSSGPTAGILVGAMTSYALGGPIVHVANGEWERGLASLGVRLAAPSIGAWIGLVAANCNQKSWCALEGLVAGFGVGMAVASAIDAVALAWKPAPKHPERASIAPDLSITPKGASIGVTGRF